MQFLHEERKLAVQKVLLARTAGKNCVINQKDHRKAGFARFLVVWCDALVNAL